MRALQYRYGDNQQKTTPLKIDDIIKYHRFCQISEEFHALKIGDDLYEKGSGPSTKYTGKGKGKKKK